MHPALEAFIDDKQRQDEEFGIPQGSASWFVNEQGDEAIAIEGGILYRAHLSDDLDDVVVIETALSIAGWSNSATGTRIAMGA